MRRFSIMTLALFFAASLPAQELTRDKIPAAEKWKLTDLYKSDAAWTKAKNRVQKRFPKLQAQEKNFGKSAATMKAALELIYDVEKDVRRLYSYAMMRADEDSRNAKGLALRSQIEMVAADYNAATAWLKPAVLQLGKSKVKAYLKKDPSLEVYGPVLDNYLRRAPHTLSAKEEKILADSGLIADAPMNIYKILTNADMQFPQVTLADGNKITLNQSAYARYRASSNRQDRIKVFQTFWQVYRDYARTLGVALDSNIKRDIFFARSRGYNSALEAALDENNIPVAVYNNLVKDVRKNLPTLHRYLKLRARMLGIRKLAYHDLYPSLVKKVDMRFTYPEAKKVTLAALEPLGKDYTSALAKGLESRWIDVHPTPGKRMGAYSNGSAYGVHPYILLNFNGDYTDVSTLAHEIGHTMHSWYSNKTQPFPTADYPIFVAEVASITNEGLLIHHMLKKEKDPETRLFLLGNYLESMRTTVFRQTMFAEFERDIHAAAEKGEALTSERLTKIYGDLLRTYHGHKAGVCTIDELYANEWAFIPHFYYNFYVYQYATGMVAATALYQRVLNGGDKELADYHGFLQAGSSRYSIDILKSAGVDLTTSKPFNATIKVMNGVMDEIETILKQQKKSR